MFQVGDVVRCVVASQRRPDLTQVGAQYTVEGVGMTASAAPVLFLEGVFSGFRTIAEWDLAGIEGVRFYGHNPARFRKVQKRNSSLSIESFLTIKPGQFEGPKRPVNQPGKVKA